MALQAPPPAPFTWGPGGTPLTPGALASRRLLAEALMKQGSDYSPIRSWTQGMARVADALVGGMETNRYDKQEYGARLQGGQNYENNLDSAFGLGGPAASGSPQDVVPGASGPTSDASTSGAGGNAYANAIASLESGGNYSAVGPATGGDHAYGKYQVMGANVGPWTKETLGTEMTPEDFLKNPAAQDAVFQKKFGDYVQKYGNPQDAASAWFTGRPQAQGGNATDVLGTSGNQYVARFDDALKRGAGAPAPVQVASNDPGFVPPPDAAGGGPPPPAGPSSSPGAAMVNAAMPPPGGAPMAFAPQPAPSPGAAAVAAAMPPAGASMPAPPAGGPVPQGAPPQAPQGPAMGYGGGDPRAMIHAYANEAADPWAPPGAAETMGGILSSRLTPQISWVPGPDSMEHAYNQFGQELPMTRPMPPNIDILGDGTVVDKNRMRPGTNAYDAGAPPGGGQPAGAPAGGAMSAPAMPPGGGAPVAAPAGGAVAPAPAAPIDMSKWDPIQIQRYEYGHAFKPGDADQVKTAMSLKQGVPGLGQADFTPAAADAVKSVAENPIYLAGRGANSAVKAMGATMAADDPAANAVFLKNFANAIAPGKITQKGPGAVTQIDPEVPDTLAALYKKAESIVNGGGFLPAPLKKDMMDAAVRQATSLSQSARDLLDANTKIAANQGIHLDKLVPPVDPVTDPRTPPAAGTVVDGYRFKGGDPSKQTSWEPVT